MKTLNLLNVPKDSPTRREEIRMFKAQHQIETNHARHLSKDEGPWMAVHLPSCWKLGYGCTDKSNLVECAMHVGRLMDEAGYATYDKTEAGAIRQLCANSGIPCDL